MPEQPTNSCEAPEFVRNVRRWFLVRHLWFRHLKRWQRWAVRLSIGLPLVLLALLMVLTRSPVTRSLILPRLERASNLEIDADSVYVRANGRLVMTNARFRVPGVSGPAGLVLQAERLSAEVDWEDAIWGQPRVREVELIRPVVRISQSLHDRSMNFAAIAPPDVSAGQGRSRMRLPRVVAEDGAIELGEHTPARYTMLKRLPVEGLLTPAPRGEKGYVIGLAEHRRDRPGEKPGFRIQGRIDDDSLAVSMDDFSLDDWPPETIPKPSRELFANLGLRGRVPKASFRYSEEQGVTAELTLDGVELNLPFEPEERPPGGERFMRMHGVKGTLTFREDGVLVGAEGLLEDLPYRVWLLYHGTSADAPFMCEVVSEGFQVERVPRLLPFAPKLVAKRLAQFSGPTATLDTRLLIRRDSPTEEGPGAITFKGTMNVSNGRAAFEKFPYPFEHLSAKVYFDNERVEVRDVHGVSPTGATLTAHAYVAPANDDAQIDVWVDVVGAPIDEALEAAFGPGRDRVMHALFNRDKHKRLVDAGLVISPEDAAEARERLNEAKADLARATGAAADELTARVASLEAMLARPVFDFGGLADVSVRVHRPPGDEVEWTSDVDVRIRRAGLVPDAFPLPINARDVVCTIRDNDAKVSGGTYEGLTGGTGTVQASFVLPPSKDPGADPRADVTIDLADMPMDARAIFALPGPADSSLKRMLTGLNLRGTVAGRVHVAPLDVLGRADPSSTTSGFDADLSLANATAAPADPGVAGAPGVLIVDGGGQLRVTERTAHLNLDARTAGGVGAGTPLSVETKAEFEIKRDPNAPAPPPRVATTVRVPGGDLRLPVERVVRVFSEKAADQIVRLRGVHRPEGVLDVVARIEVADQATRSVRLDLTSAGALSFDWLGGRVGTSDCEGKVSLECIGGVEGEFTSVAGPMTFDGQPVGHVRLDGRYRFAKPPGAGVEDDPGRVLHVSGRGGRFESPFVPAVLATPVGRERLATYASISPRGLFDAEVDIRGGGGDPLRVKGTVQPRAFACVIDGTELVFDGCSGWLTFDGPEGTFQGLTGRAPGWACTVDGGWKKSEGGVLLDMDLGVRAESLTPDALVLLPPTLRKALKDIKLKVDGPYSVTDAHLTLLAGVERTRAWSRFDGIVDFRDLSLEAGAVITGCEGRFSAHQEQAAGGTPVYRLGVVADRFSIGAAEAHDARAVIQSGAMPGEVVLPLITGECHHGRFAGRVRVAPVGDTEREYAASFQLSGVDFGLLMHDMTTPAPGAVPIGAPASDQPAAPAPGARGLLDADLSIAGFIGVPETRRGRGSLRVSGDDVRVLNLPGIVPLIEVSNLALPANEALDYAEAEFYVDGGVVSFDRLSVFSKAIEIAGFGTMTWPSMQMDFRFNSRSARPIPMLSFMLQGIRNQLVATSVRGTPKKPEVRLISMPGTRRMLGRVIGTEETERSRRLLELERRSSLSRHGIRPTGRAIPGSVNAGGASRDDP